MNNKFGSRVMHRNSQSEERHKMLKIKGRLISNQAASLDRLGRPAAQTFTQEMQGTCKSFAFEANLCYFQNPF